MSFYGDIFLFFHGYVSPSLFVHTSTPPYGLAAYFMFQAGMYWLIALMIAAVLEIYTLWVIGKEKDK